MINLAYNLANIINTRNSTNHKNLLNSNPKTFPVSVREKEGLSINRRGSRNISKSKEGVMGILDVWTTCTLAGVFRGRGIGGCIETPPMFRRSRQQNIQKLLFFLWISINENVKLASALVFSYSLNIDITSIRCKTIFTANP